MKITHQEEAEMTGLPPQEMSELEKNLFPEDAEDQNDHKLFVNERNYILSEWHKNLNEYLHPSNDYDEDIYKYLNRYGFINFGKIKNKPSVKQEQNVIIIGAGIAGISAGNQLKNFGYKVKILEARKRTGGRILTKSTYKNGKLSTSIDMGAMIITGTIGNPVSTICEQMKLKLHVIDTKNQIFDFDGKRISHEIDDSVEKNFNKFLDEISENRRDNFQSLGETLKNRIDQYLETIQDKERKGQEKRLFGWHIANLEYGCGTDLLPVSLKHWDQDDIHELDGDHCFVKEGYTAMVDEYSQNLDIELNQIVYKIENFKNGVKVHTNQGIYSGDVVLVTVPLSVLKNQTIEFSPPLPKWKISTIDNLGFGLLNKVTLYFSKPFWDTKLDYLGYLNSERRGEFYLMWNMYHVCDRPVLVALVAGKAAYEIENESDEYVQKKMMKALRKMYGEKIPEPNKIFKTSWNLDPFAGGSYSFIKLGSKGGIEYDIMSQRVNKIFFAGEATCKEHPSTVLGGLLSGFRAAGQIDDFFENKKREEEETVVISRDRSKIEYQKLFTLILEKYGVNGDVLDELVEFALEQNNSDEYVFNAKIMKKLEKILKKFLVQKNNK
eukprot:gene12157-5647_t